MRRHFQFSLARSGGFCGHQDEAWFFLSILSCEIRAKNKTHTFTNYTAFNSLLRDQLDWCIAALVDGSILSILSCEISSRAARTTAMNTSLSILSCEISLKSIRGWLWRGFTFNSLLRDQFTPYTSLPVGFPDKPFNSLLRDQRFTSPETILRELRTFNSLLRDQSSIIERKSPYSRGLFQFSLARSEQVSPMPLQWGYSYFQFSLARSVKNGKF